MTYRAGVSGSLAAYFPEHDSEPTLTCDVVGCGVRITVRPVRGCMPAWLRDKKAPPRWRRYPQPDGKPAKHTCPECTAALKRGGVDIVVRRESE